MAETNMTEFAAMQTGKPLARYVKNIVGKVYVTALDPFTDQPMGMHLEGNQYAGDPKSFIELFSEKSLVFFERMNRTHIEAGRIMKTEKEPEVEESPNQITDEEIDELLGSKFMVLKNRLATFTDVAPILRILNRARELEKSEKLISHIEKRMSDIQIEGYK